MLIAKIFHLHQPLGEARERLREPGAWSGNDAEVHCSMIEPERIGRCEFSFRQGQQVSADIEEVPGGDPNRILFRSVAGNVELAGMVELFEIRPALTEVVLTVDYEAVSPPHRAFDALDRFLNRQLARLEGAPAAA